MQYFTFLGLGANNKSYKEVLYFLGIRNKWLKTFLTATFSSEIVAVTFTFLQEQQRTAEILYFQGFQPFFL